MPLPQNPLTNIMPRKTAQSRRGRPRKQQVAASVVQPQPSQKWFRWGESYTSLMMGIIVVIIAFLFVGSLAKLRHTQQVTSTSIVNTTAVEKALDETQKVDKTTLSVPSQKVYVVQAGDDLWSISEKFYNSGYNWVDIAKANKLDNPGTLFAGTELIIPNVTPAPTAQMQQAQVTPTPTPVTGEHAIKGNTYTVQAGDTLWDIAVRAYADGYRWNDIAKANNLSEPDLIFSGNILKLPR